MQPFYPNETTLKVTGQICYTTNEFFKLRSDIAAYAITFGSITLIIGVLVGLGLAWIIPKARQKIKEY